MFLVADEKQFNIVADYFSVDQLTHIPNDDRREDRQSF